MDYLIRPVREGLLAYTNLRDGSVTLEDLFILNSYLDNEIHNRRVAEKIVERKNG
ncbi:MAG: hypothetical protein PUG38_09715 [Sutterellaceae bacterium]|nr:hypothetical protein [Sutterellaceae bacterium]MDY2868024.1 hypothetical protein [Mesosutterella sp.]